MSFILLKKEHKLIYRADARRRWSLDYILDQSLHFIISLLYSINFYKIFAVKTHRDLKNWEDLLKLDRQPARSYTEVSETITKIKISFTVSFPIEYLAIVNNNLMKLLRKYPFYNEHGSLSVNKNQIKDTFTKLKNLENFNTSHDAFLCTFDFSDRFNNDKIDGVNIHFIKLFESSVILRFELDTNDLFLKTFNKICSSREWISSVPVWNDWKSILMGYRSILHVSNEDRIRRLSYHELLKEVRSVSEKIIVNPLTKGVNKDLLTIGNESLIYEVSEINEINLDSSIFRSIHSKPRRAINIDKFTYYEASFDTYDIFVVPLEDASPASLTASEVGYAIYELSIIQFYNRLFQIISTNQHYLNFILYKLLEKKWFNLSKLRLYKKVAEIKIKLVFMKNMYRRTIADSDFIGMRNVIETTDLDKDGFYFFIHARRKGALEKIDKLLASTIELTDDANYFTTSYLTNFIQYFSIILAVFALPNLHKILTLFKALITYITSGYTMIQRLIHYIFHFFYQNS